MDATQAISESFLDSDESENEKEDENKRRGQPLAKLCILKNEHTSETELPLYVGDNVLGRDPNTCTLFLPASSVSKQHATIAISVHSRRGRRGEGDIEALVWDHGSMNGTRKGRFKLTPNVRYALSDGDGLVVADIACQYVSCSVDASSSQGGMRTPVGRNVGLKAGSPCGSETKGSHQVTDGKSNVNGDMKARASSSKTPVRGSCLSFEQTPTQPEGTLVPESESDSDGEVGGRGRKALVSVSDSHKSSPACSTFLSPTNVIVPESEDESPITPSSSAMNSSYRHVRLSKEETEEDVAGQRLEEKKTLAEVDDSEEEEGGENETTAPEGTTSEGSGRRVPETQERDERLKGGDESPLSKTAVSTDAIPVFNMDSDTDVEGEDEEVACVVPVTLNTNQVGQPPDLEFHMDSDTDVDEDEDEEESDKAPKTVAASNDNVKIPHVNSVTQPEGVTVDSDTDVDEDAAVAAAVATAAAASDTATKSEPLSVQPAPAADSAPETRPEDPHLDGDTDVDDEKEERGNGANQSNSELDESPIKLNVKPTGPDDAAPPPPPPPHDLHLDSDTDDETTLGGPSVVSAGVTEAQATADRGVAFLSDSDTDAEDSSPRVMSAAPTTPPASAGAKSAGLGSDSDTDVDEVTPADLRVDSDTDVEDEKASDDQIPDLCRENTPGLLVPLVQNCSTPLQLPEGEMENMDTQLFVSPSSLPLRRAAAPAVRPVTPSSCSDSQEDGDFVVAETQSFTLQTRGAQSSAPENHAMEPTQAYDLDSSGDESDEASKSFQLGLSDSNNPQRQAQALAMESTQAYVSVERSLNMEATQAYGEDEESAACSGREERVDFVLEETQAYISKPDSDSESDTDEEGRKNVASAETQPYTSSLTASLAGESGTEHEEPAQPQQRASAVVLSLAQTQPLSPHGSDDEEEEDTEPLVMCDFSNVETQPMLICCSETQPIATSDREDSDDEDSIPGLRTRRAKALPLEEETTQTLTNSELSVRSTQPVDTREASESAEEDSIPVSRRRRAKPVPLEETQSLCGSEALPMGACESDEEDSIPVSRRRRAKPVPLEETQSLCGSEAPPMGACESDEEDSPPGPRKREAKQLRLEDEETQALLIDTQPIDEDKDTADVDDEDSIPGPRKRKAKAAQPLRTPEVSAASEAGVSVRSTRHTRQRAREEEEEDDRSEPPKRQTRGKSKALPVTRGRRQTSRPDVDESEEEEEAVPVRMKRGRRSTRQLNNEEDGKCETDENSSLIKEVGLAKRGDSDLRLKDDRQKEEERKEREEKERIENERKAKEEKERLEKERQQRIEKERKEQEEKKRLEKERKEREETERKEQVEKERLEKERKEREEYERVERERKEQERLERKRRENEEKERLKREKAERDEKEKLEREEEIERERKETEEKERKEREEENKEEQARREKEERERAATEAEEKRVKEQRESEVTSRGRRAARKTAATAPDHDDDDDDDDGDEDDVPARRTRSRSNSSNSISSERSASGLGTQGSRARGRGRGAHRASEPPQTAGVRSSARRRTAAAEPDRRDGALSRSNSSSSLNSDISSCSASSQSRGRGGRQRGSNTRVTRAEPRSIPLLSNRSDPAAARGRRGRRTEPCPNVAPREEKEQPSTTRGQRRATASNSADQSGWDEGQGKRDVRGAARKPTAGDGEEARDKRQGRKREMEAGGEEESRSGAKVPKVREEVQTQGDEQADESPAQAKRRGRASGAQVKTDAEEVEDEESEETAVVRKVRSRPSAVQKRVKEEQAESGASVHSQNREAQVQMPEPQTPVSRASRKRQAPVDSSPVAKTSRSSSSSSSSPSPAARGRLQAGSQAFKVLFTGVVDETGEKVLTRLGGSMAKGVADMNYLVTDKVRRTVKFLCAVAKGIPIITPLWLEKSGKAGSLLSPHSFVVKDPEQEKKFSFCLQTSLTVASSVPLLQGYEIHVTRSVKPEPVQMKDIISCSGATFLPRMPSSHKPHTVVVSCEEDWALCGPARSVSLPVVTAEFILTGILQQKVDFEKHVLVGPVAAAGGRGRTKRRT